MKRSVTLALGCGALALRVAMETLAMDEKGLLIPWHWTTWTLLALGLLAGLWLWCCWSATGTWAMYDEFFPKSVPQGSLSILGGLAMGFHSLFAIDEVELLLGLACGIIMIVLGVLRCLGKKPPFALHCGLCAYWIAELVRQYPQWSSSSQVHDYAFHLLALVALMLYAFHRCSADAGSLQPKNCTATALAAMGLCIPALMEAETGLWYLSALLWVAGSMGTLAPTKCQLLVEKYGKERDFSTLMELLCRLDVQGFLALGETFAQWIPELKPCLGFDQKTPHHAYDVYTHTACVAGNLPQEPALRLAGLLHDIGKPQCQRIDGRGRGHFKGHALRSAQLAQPILERLGAPLELTQEVRWLIARHMIKPQNEKAMAVVRLQAQDGWLEHLTLLQRADAQGKGV